MKVIIFYSDRFKKEIVCVPASQADNEIEAQANKLMEERKLIERFTSYRVAEVEDCVVNSLTEMYSIMLSKDFNKPKQKEPEREKRLPLEDGTLQLTLEEDEELRKLLPFPITNIIGVYFETLDFIWIKYLGNKGIETETIHNIKPISYLLERFKLVEK